MQYRVFLRIRPNVKERRELIFLELRGKYSAKIRNSKKNYRNFHLLR